MPQPLLAEQSVQQIEREVVVVDALVHHAQATGASRSASNSTIFSVRDPASIPAQIMTIIPHRFHQCLQSRSQRRLQGITERRYFYFYDGHAALPLDDLAEQLAFQAAMAVPEIRETTTASAPNRRTSAAIRALIDRRADHRIGNRDAGVRLHRRQVRGNRVQDGTEEILRAAHPPAGLFQQVHHSQIGHRINPENPRRRPSSTPSPACTRLRTSASNSVNTHNASA